ncbi:putative amidohydrolase [Paractinoplanes deccanensis]|uniref:Amidohydrolase n=1 Tax=Paractinoplanes deccanensis TaxID=113561 RepID=A0ABQ3Y3A8_9ACTN|nr:amidohydrolase family protein [Actinoplanes deccanensis]GID74450.1 putative amidohydrolase [Actinoplanes deccanensis]
MTSSSRLTADRVLVTSAALADGTADAFTPDVSLLAEGGVITRIWTGEDPPSVEGATVVDGSGATLVPGLVDSHAHVSLPGGARWVEHGFDPLGELLAVGEENGEMMVRAGIRWARDVGSPRRDRRAAALTLRDRWRGNPERPYLRAAGTWISRRGAMPPGLTVEIEHAADLVAAVRGQLDDGADLVKLYLDGPDADAAPFSVAEVAAAVDVVHARGAKVAAHATAQAGTRLAAAAGVDSLEHGNEIDGDTAALMASKGVTLVSTLAVAESWLTFGRDGAAEMRETMRASVRAADAAGVTIAAGSDAGGGSLRANQLAWEVQSLIEAGVSPRTALAAVTWRGGDLLGIPGAGRLAVGGPAHFSLVHGDPLTDPAALWRVWLTR